MIILMFELKQIKQRDARAGTWIQCCSIIKWGIVLRFVRSIWLSFRTEGNEPNECN